ncbi:cysteine--tRNA ligase [Candidatus Magnetaquicoccus inordinatus]|uniref:cysteine--tRNA ligase n=1 Tax=Candidatus Magnetaquicoccus inordinatus TaxID=2496818 RepID=UPI003B968560
MQIQLFNSKGRRKELLQLREPGRVGIYVCGVTVYDHCHIGHARVMVVFDVIVRYLRACGLQVTYVRNFTDIDDKIIQRAQSLQISIGELTERYIAAFHQDMAGLGVAEADVEPRATEHLPEMQAMIARLLANGHAYSDGRDVYYAVDRFHAYGELSGKQLSELQAGARVEVDSGKRNPLDFVLWKAAKADEPRWSSPWGAGRPGWHIECSAMSCKYLGEAFDIHGGGMDLLFPHHENEIAQTEGSTGHPWVRYWLHNGFVNVLSASGEREKMSKSLGNFSTIRDLLAHYPGEVLRLFILNSHYRSPLDFSGELLEAARHGMDRLYSALATAKQLLGELPHVSLQALQSNAASAVWQEAGEPFFQAMDDDFNTPQAIAILFELAKKINRSVALVQQGAAEERLLLQERIALLRALSAVCGLLTEEPEHYFHRQAGAGPQDAEIEALLQQRLAARQARDFAAADRIRQQLADAGIIVLDSKEGTTWRRS